MKKLIALVVLSVAMTGVMAAEKAKKEPSPAQLAQQQKMKNCSAEAKQQALKGDARKKFMKECLKADKP